MERYAAVLKLRAALGSISWPVFRDWLYWGLLVSRAFHLRWWSLKQLAASCDGLFRDRTAADPMPINALGYVVSPQDHQQSCVEPAICKRARRFPRQLQGDPCHVAAGFSQTLTRPISTGAPTGINTTGMSEVTDFAATPPTVPPITRMSTLGSTAKMASFICARAGPAVCCLTNLML